jgi:hypothetical protein
MLDGVAAVHDVYLHVIERSRRQGSAKLRSWCRIRGGRVLERRLDYSFIGDVSCRPKKIHIARRESDLSIYGEHGV